MLTRGEGVNMVHAVSKANFNRVPPQDLDAEKSVLGAMMLSKDAIGEVVSPLSPEDFYAAKHGVIFSAIRDLFARGEPADAVAVKARLEKLNQLEQAGGSLYLQDLIAFVPTVANVGYYADIVIAKSKLRALISTGTRIVQLGYDSEEDVNNIMDTAQAEMYSLTEKHVSNDYQNLNAILPRVFDELEKNNGRDGELSGLSTGFGELDKLLSGLRPGQMIIVAGRPGHGKSTLAMDFCRHISTKEKKAVAFFSLEMNSSELVTRMLSAESGVFLSKLIKGDLQQPDWQRLADTIARMSNVPFIVDDSPNLTMTEIRAKARRLKQQEDVGLIVIDYLQLLTGGGKKVESRQQEVSEFSRSIKLLAKELDIPIIAVAQLNRNPEARQDKKPQVSDLRESGSLEQDADVILLIHRKEDVEMAMSAPPSEIIVGKNRSGPTGAVELMFQGNRSRFANLGSGAEY